MKICMNCGKENPDSSVFCNSCGKRLDAEEPEKNTERETYDENLQNQQTQRLIVGPDRGENFSNYSDTYSKKKENGPNKKIFVVLGVLVLLLTLGVVYTQYSKAQKEQVATMQSSALASEEKGKYDEASKLYSDLYKKTKDENYKGKADEMKAYAENKAKLDAGNEAFRAQDYQKAAENYLAVDEKAEKVYKEAQSNIDKVADIYAEDIINLIKEKKYDEAIGLAKKNLKILPDNVKLTDLKDQANNFSMAAATDKGNKELESKIADLESKLEENKTNTIVVNGTEGRTYGSTYNSPGAALIGTTQTITSDSAHVRSGPGKGYGALYYLQKGDTVYIYDTYYESSDRTWCNIGDGWVSYNTMNGSGR
ncbi:MAG: zinc-ribbon domain-containing protein [Finegoldia sp.]|nr:zinc-ribbon domain-containing protein [Finegoldia sp.]